MMERTAIDPSSCCWRSTFNGSNLMIPCSFRASKLQDWSKIEVDIFTSMLKKIRVPAQALNEAYMHSLKSRW
jgi:hypothetical protein